MTQKEIAEVMKKATGYPVSGKVAEAIEVMAKAVHEALNPVTKAEKPKKETASIEPQETR